MLSSTLQGGPLMTTMDDNIRMKIIGVVSFGQSCDDTLADPNNSKSCQLFQRPL